MKASKWFYIVLALLFVLGSTVQINAQSVEFEGRLYYTADNISTAYITVEDTNGDGAIDTINRGPALVISSTHADGITFDQNGIDILAGAHDNVLRVPTSGGPVSNVSVPFANAVADHIILDHQLIHPSISRVWTARSVGPGDPSLTNQLEDTDLGSGSVQTTNVQLSDATPVDVSGLAIVDLDGFGTGSPGVLWLSDNAGGVYSINVGTSVATPQVDVSGEGNGNAAHQLYWDDTLGHLIPHHRVLLVPTAFHP